VNRRAGRGGLADDLVRIVAIAHKMAHIVYHLLTHQTPFRDLSAAAYEPRARNRDVVLFRKKAPRRGLTLVESHTSSANL
jgi:hypothetical protein